MGQENLAPKLEFKKKFGYSVGQMGDSIGYNIFGFFFLFFLTDVAGVAPGVAGTISLLAVMWDAVTDPAIGFISDNLKSKFGRRRPLMLASAFPYAVCVFLLFNNVPLEGMAKNAYYIIMAMIFWTVYTMYVIPYFALGAELTNDYEERNSLRSWASVFIYLAVMLASATPPIIVDFVVQRGGDINKGWNTVGFIFGLLVLIFILVCWYTTKGGELKQEAIPVAKQERRQNIFVTFYEIFKLKPTKSLAISVFLWSFVSAMYNAALVYVMTNNLGYSASLQATYFFAMSLIAIIQVPFINWSANKFGKRGVYIATTVFSGIAFIVFNFIGFPSFAFMLVYAVLVMLGTTVYWTLYYSMMYDISEVDEYINNKRREGAITAIMAFCQKLGAAIALQSMGLILQFGGYDATLEVQSESALACILALTTSIPGVIGLLGGLIMLLYPLTGERFALLMNALNARKNGKEYSEEGLEKLI